MPRVLKEFGSGRRWIPGGWRLPISVDRPAHRQSILPKLQALLEDALTASPSNVWGIIHLNISTACELRRDLAPSTHDNPWAIRNPLDEARDLYKMTVYGSCTVESIRELISVPPEIEAALMAYADLYPKDGDRIRCVLRFRKKVGVEFERLLQANAPVADSMDADMEEDAVGEEAQSDVENEIPAESEVHSEVELFAAEVGGLGPMES